MARLVPIILALMFVGLWGTAHGIEEISITTGKKTYTYGERLSFSVTISNVTGDTAILDIIDQSNRSSSPINMIITKPNTNITAPVPFYRTTFSPGTYHINIEYGGSSASTSFQLVDTENISIPPAFKIVASSWVNNQTSDRLFGEHIAELLNSGVIMVNNYHEENTTVIPSWFKQDAKWWSNNLISDNDFGDAVKYLIESGIMKT